MKERFDYQAIARLDLLDPKYRLLHKLNVFALISIIVASVVGIALNWVLRNQTAAGGIYFVYIICGFIASLVYPYLHEFAHGFAVIITKFKAPIIKFGKLAATCGSPDIVFGKFQYLFVASFPFIAFCGALIPLCIFLPSVYFPIIFMPLMYNVFGSIADWVLVKRVATMPYRSIVVDNGSDVVVYVPITKNEVM